MLNIKNPEADRLARILALRKGVTITEVIIEALQEKLLREQGKKVPAELKKSLLEISQRCAALPEQHALSPEEIIGYDQHGLPK